MRLSYLSGKEIINVSDGSRLGIIDECELTFDPASGRIHAMLLDNPNPVMRFFRENSSSTIPWQGIKQIGDDVILVNIIKDYDSTGKLYRHK